MISAKRLCLIAVIIFIQFLNTPARGAQDNELKKQFDFAESLFFEAEYYRAITEYKRFIFYFPQEKDLAEQASYRIGESYFKAARWQEGLREFSRFIDKYPNSLRYNDARFLKGLCEKYLKEFDYALSTFEEIVQDEKASSYRNKAIYQIALIRMDKGEWQSSQNAFSRISKDDPLYQSANAMADGLSRINEVPQKSPWFAGILAAVLPGSGHLYTKRPKDAIVSFLLNGSFIWAAAELFSDDKYAAGTVFAFFELAWYSGNIYSAYNGAQKYNKNEQDFFIESLKEKSGISYYFDPNERSIQVRYSFKF